MNIKAGLQEYILQTHNTNFFEDSMGGVWTPLTPPPLDTPLGTIVSWEVVQDADNKTEMGRFNAQPTGS